MWPTFSSLALGWVRICGHYGSESDRCLTYFPAVSGRATSAPIVNTPARSARERAKLITQFVGKRIVRDIPATVRVNANFPLHGICEDAWAGPLRLLNADGARPARSPLHSVSALLGSPLEGSGNAEGVARSVWMTTYPPETVDVEATARSPPPNPRR